MKPSDILLAGANRIIENGLWKGDPVEDRGDAATRPHCLVTSVWATCDEDFKGLDVDGSIRVETCALVYLQQALGVKDLGSVMEWNDDPLTTEPMVLGVLHEAALLAKEDGQ